ncbi:class I SAM-dependent methyltransferase [bacterium]|nr:class I SAM-dependent methyltransferase [bacterium]
MDKRFIHSLSELNDIIECELCELPEEKIIDELTKVFLKLPDVNKFKSDPFSDEYLHEIKQLFYKLTNTTSYAPEINEKAKFLTDGSSNFRNFIAPYNYNYSNFVGDLLSAYGLVVKSLDVKSGDSILEYGAGTGGISIPLARMGCLVSVIDIDNNYLEIIRKQCQWYDIKIRTKEGLFGENINDNDKYDRILFYEAFHHSLDHQHVLRKLPDMLNENGMIYFTGEPILDEESYFSDAVPYMWGPRLDGLSLRAMRDQGWCELGFKEKYFIHLLLKNGFTVRKNTKFQNNRANGYIAELNNGSIDISKGHLIESVNLEKKIHKSEETFVWTSSSSSIPLDQYHHWDEIEFCFYNPLPLAREVNIIADKNYSLKIPEKSRKSFKIKIYGILEEIFIDCEPFVPSKKIAGSNDTRELGIAIETINYYLN